MTNILYSMALPQDPANLPTSIRNSVLLWLESISANLD